jgi:hypothetical protein
MEYEENALQIAEYTRNTLKELNNIPTYLSIYIGSIRKMCVVIAFNV